MLETTATPPNDRNCEPIEKNLSVNGCEKFEKVSSPQLAEKMESWGSP